MTNNSFWAVRIDFGDNVRQVQYDDERTARTVLLQARAQYGYNNASLVQVHY